MDALALRTAQPADCHATTFDKDAAHTPTLPEKPPASPEPVAFNYVQTDSVVALLTNLGAALLVSTYQANKLLAVRAQGQGLSLWVRTVDRPMGIAADARRIALGTRNQVWTLRNAPDIAPRVEPAGMHDACYLPCAAHVTGDIGVQKIAWAGDELWMVSTRFSCLATLEDNYSFVPKWQPPFITALAVEDRCHLNGLAMRDGRLAFGRGWRHSCGSKFRQSENRNSVARFHPRLGFAGRYAFVGLSKIRPTPAIGRRADGRSASRAEVRHCRN